MPDPRHRAPDTPVDIVRAALLEPVPCPTCGRTEPCRCLPQRDVETDTMARRIVERLTGAGVLHLDTGPPREATQDDIEQAAAWLAAQSRHPRYVDVDEGWKQLLASDGNVTHAHAAAVKAAQPATQQQLADLAAAKSLLIAWHRQRRATGTEGA